LFVILVTQGRGRLSYYALVHKCTGNLLEQYARVNDGSRHCSRRENIARVVYL
jgi:hypothetical protein